MKIDGGLEIMLDSITNALTCASVKPDDPPPSAQEMRRMASRISREAEKELRDVCRRVQGNRPTESSPGYHDMRLILVGVYRRCLELLGESPDATPAVAPPSSGD